MSAAAFQVTVQLDGDDSTTEATNNVLDALSALLLRLMGEGQIRAWHIHKEET